MRPSSRGSMCHHGSAGQAPGLLGTYDSKVKGESYPEVGPPV